MLPVVQVRGERAHEDPQILRFGAGAHRPGAGRERLKNCARFPARPSRQLRDLPRRRLAPGAVYPTHGPPRRPAPSGTPGARRDPDPRHHRRRCGICARRAADNGELRSSKPRLMFSADSAMRDRSRIAPCRCRSASPDRRLPLRHTAGSADSRLFRIALDVRIFGKPAERPVTMQTC